MVSRETSACPTWHYIWKCSYWWLPSMCQISCLYQKVHNLPEISSYAAGLLYLSFWGFSYIRFKILYELDIWQCFSSTRYFFCFPVVWHEIAARKDCRIGQKMSSFFSFCVRERMLSWCSRNRHSWNFWRYIHRYKFARPPWKIVRGQIFQVPDWTFPL